MINLTDKRTKQMKKIDRIKCGCYIKKNILGKEALLCFHISPKIHTLLLRQCIMKCVVLILYVDIGIMKKNKLS